MTAVASRLRGSAVRPDTAGRSTFLLLFALVAVLNLIGLVMVLSASSVVSLREFGSTWSYFGKQATWVALGAVALGATVALDYHLWRKLALPMLAVCVGLLVVVLTPTFGIEVNGARSWLGAGALRMQPSELTKLALLLVVANLLANRSRSMADSRLTLRPVLLVSGVVAVLMMLQPDLGGTMVMGTIVFAILFVAGVPVTRLTGAFVLAAGGAVWLALGTGYRRNRVLAFLDPAGDPGDVGYHINQSLMGIASGRLTGVGLGAGRAKYGFLPNAHTDFIFAIISEELGLLGAVLVVALFGGFAVLGVRAALHAPDRFGTLVAAGITAWLLAQAFVNIGGNIGILPITGLTLPFISFGGSSLVIAMAAAGILLNIAKAGRRPAPAVAKRR